MHNLWQHLGRQTRTVIHLLLLAALTLVLHWHNTQPVQGSDGEPEESAEIALRKAVKHGWFNADGEIEASSVDSENEPEKVIYTLWVKQVGAAATVRTMLIDELPPGVIATGDVRVTAEAGTVEPLQVQLDPDRLAWRGALSPGAVLRIDFSVWVRRCAQQPDDQRTGVEPSAVEITNTAYAQQTDGTRVQASATFRTQCPPGSDHDDPKGIDVAVHKSGELRRTAHPDTGEVQPQIFWTITYANLGDIPATNVRLIDRLDGLNINDYVLDVVTPEGVHAAREDDYLLFGVREIPPGQRFRIGIITSIPPVDDAGDAKVINYVTARVADDVNPQNNQARAAVRIAPQSPVITSPQSGATCRNEISVEGTAVPNAHVTVFVNDEPITRTQANERGQWRAALRLDNGAYALHAQSTVGPLDSLPSESVRIRVDSSLLWDPMSLTFTGPGGATQKATNAAGLAVVDGWHVVLRPNTPYRVSVQICCDDGENAEVALRMAGGDPIILTSHGHGLFAGSLTTPAVGESTRIPVQLVVRCGDEQATGDGWIGVVAPQGIVVDRRSGDPIEGAKVTLWTVRRGPSGSPIEVEQWDGEPFGQENPHVTDATGGYYFAPPPGHYQLTVGKAGYQRFRTSVFRVDNEPIQHKIVLTPIVNQAAVHTFALDRIERERAPLRVEAGAVVKWGNTDTVEHSITVIKNGGNNGTDDSASTEPAPLPRIAQTEPVGEIWESGVIAPGESFELALESPGHYSVYNSQNPESIAEIEVVEGAAPAEPAIDEPDEATQDAPQQGNAPDTPSSESVENSIFMPAVTAE